LPAVWGSLTHLFLLSLAPADPEQSAKGLQMFQYKGTISFESDQELTPEQLDQIVFALEVQIEEPVDAEGNDEEFSTREILISLEVSE
jgi:hypothetical protein